MHLLQEHAFVSHNKDLPSFTAALINYFVVDHFLGQTFLRGGRREEAIFMSQLCTV